MAFTWPMSSKASHSKDSESERQSIQFLNKINEVLKGTPFELAFRALNELLLLVNSLNPTSDKDLQALWDDFLMTKILPRIEGDDDKLRLVNASQDSNLLKELENVLEDSFSSIWSADEERKDYFRTVKHDGTEIKIMCRSKEKLRWMRERLEINTFTSFWP